MVVRSPAQASHGVVTLVLLPGLDGTGRLFDDFIAALGPDVDAIVASYPTDQALSYAELEPIARSFLPADRPFFLLAESFSGPLGVAIAAAPPPGLMGLILCCSFVRSPRPWLALARPLARVFPLAALPLSLLSFFLLGRFASTPRRATLAATLAMVAPDALRRRAQEALAVDASALLARVKIPLLYLRAGEDRLIPKSVGDGVAAQAPQTQIVELPAPHFLLQTLPAAAATVVTRFMSPR